MLGFFFFASGLQPHSVRVFFCGANNTSLLVMVVDSERNYEDLEKYGIDLTKMANQGKLDLVIGRDEEIRRCIQIMSQRTKNNLVFIGEPGVGETIIVEGSIFHLQCLLQTVCRLWNWDLYIKHHLMSLNCARWNW